MGIVIAVVVIVVVAVIVGISLRRQRGGSAAPLAPPKAPRPDPEPMTDLEQALSQVTDGTGTSMRDRLESTAVEDLRIVDDTGPLLRRALDHVNPTAEAAAAPEPPTPVESADDDTPPS